ncbi:MAG: hypothetical protein E2582_04960 [Delftia sp.]|nr:hypothetical protein [Delftia sp.]
MNKLVAILLISIASAPTWAVNKCKAPDGRVIYQDAPCASGPGESLRLVEANGTGRSQRMPFKVLDISTEKSKEIALGAVGIAKRRLKDPESAKFSDLRVISVSAQGKIINIACGNLNAKNSYGGYVGSKQFWVYEDIFTEDFDTFVPGSNYAWTMGGMQSACAKDGISVADI